MSKRDDHGDPGSDDRTYRGLGQAYPTARARTPTPDDFGGDEPTTEGYQGLVSRHTELVEELESYRIELELQNEELRASQTTLETAQRRYYELFDLAPVGYLVLDPVGRIVNANLAASRLLATDRPILLGRSLTMYLRSEHLVGFRRELGKIMERRGHARLDGVLHRGGDGSCFDAALELCAVDRAEDAGPVCLVTILDVTDRKNAEREARRLTGQLQEANQHLSELAHRDPLTGLFNRRGLEEHLKREVARARREAAPLSALLIDCDKFKAINDQLGHVTGDVVLREVALRMSRSLRPTDLLARIGGDEFLALLPDTNVSAGAQAGQRIRLAVSTEPVIYDRSSRSLTVSIGVASIALDTASIEEVLAETQAALKTAKQRGRNHVCIGQRVIDAAQSSAWRTERGVATVIQPIVGVDGAALSGYELLSRPGHNGCSVIDMFRAASDAGELTALDLHCLRQSLRVAGAAPRSLSLHLNLLPSTILATPTDEMMQCIDDAGMQQRLSIEISEQQLIGDQAELAKRLEPLRQAGVKIVMDDLGFGRSSLEGLLVLEPEMVKIDKSLIQRASVRTDALRSLERLLKILGSLAVPAVAEGVETQTQARMVSAMGIEFGQGYFWGRPQDPSWLSD